MKFNIDQALQKGVAAHKVGNIKEAERIFQNILMSDPTHPDANHNLGLIAVSLKQIQAALPLFKNAVEANPKIEQFWLSYIDALIKEKHIDNAKKVLNQGKIQCALKGKFNDLEAQIDSINKQLNDTLLSPSKQQLNNLLENYQSGQFSNAEKLARIITQEYPKHPFGWKVLGAILGQTGRKTESIKIHQIAVTLSPKDTEAHNNLGASLQELGRLEEAKASYTQAIALDLNYAEAHSNLGNIFQELDRLEEAEASYIKAIALKPNYAEAYSNLGVILKKVGRLEEAEASYNQAIALKPNFPEAHSNLGVALKEMGRLKEAEASFIQAIALKPNYAEAHSNLGNTFKEMGKFKEAISAYVRSINLKPDSEEAIRNFTVVIKDLRFNSSDPLLYPILIRILMTGNFERPKDLAKSILSLLKHDPLIKNLLTKKNNVMSFKDVISAIDDLDQLKLLHNLMRICPLPDIDLEELFAAKRRVLLINLHKIELSHKLVDFLSTLSLHCFTNEYIYFETEQEIKLVQELKMKISKTISKSKQPKLFEVFCLSFYRPLHCFDWCEKLKVLDQFEELKKRLIEEPIAERKIALDIPLIEHISDEVSLKVRKQYEENPYPRWVRLEIPVKAKTISEVCEDYNLYLHSKSVIDVIAPKILVAGCGTGQHAIGTASRFSNNQLLAVDLSLASLAYAKRKTNELGINHLEYLQADILDLYKLGREFDIIESVGVLHHMDNPMIGWKILTDILKPGGLMKIGLYSDLARHQIVKVRDKIALLKVKTSETDIRTFRWSIGMSRKEKYKRLTTSSDFYSLSTVRDLIFHVQEHRFTIPQFGNCLKELGLKFCGFENKDIISRFRIFHGDNSNIYDLALWHEFEKSNPNDFMGMYQFWCQKL